jgi:predicted DNA-binding transcriptional regulator AlpA
MLLRFPDLKEYGVNNWVTLGRWIKEEGFPAGFYLAKNTRAWHKDHCDAWLANRPKADPPPEIKGGGPVSPGTTARKPKPPLSPTNISESAPACKALPNGRAAR